MNGQLNPSPTTTTNGNSRIRKELLDITNRIHAAQNMKQILVDLKNGILNLFNANSITIYVVDKLRNEIYSMFLAGTQLKEIRLPINNKSIAGYVANTGTLINIENAYNQKELKNIEAELSFDDSWDKKSGFKTRQVLVAPIYNSNQLMGVIQILNRKIGEGKFSEEEIGLALEIAEVLGVAFYNQQRFVRHRKTRFDYLINHDLLKEEDLETAWKESREKKETIENFLMHKYKISKDDIGKSFEEFYNCRFIKYNDKIPRRGKNLNLCVLRARLSRGVLPRDRGENLFAIQNICAIIASSHQEGTMSSNVIRVVGAREHNLKNITVEIPRDKLVVITGLSGSGKSSLAFDTIFAEGQRRYVESLSAYARQFLGQMQKPDVDYIEGLSPAVSIDQKGTSHNPRSTVGTVTEIYDYLRLLFARVGIPHCPICGREVVKQSAQEIVDSVQALPEATRILVLAPVVRGRKGTYQAVFEEIRKAGFSRARVDGTVFNLEEEISLDRYKIHTIEAVVDRLVISPSGTAEEQKANQTRLTDSVETALKFGDGYLTVSIVPNQASNGQESQSHQSGDHKTGENESNDLHYSEHLACPEHGISIPEIEPRTFSFNTPHGACPDCQGLGNKLEIDPDRVIDPEKSLCDGALIAMEWNNVKDDGNPGYYWQMLEAMAQHYHIDMNKPFKELPAEERELVLHGTRGEKVRLHYHNRDGRQATFDTAFEGVIGNLERRYRETNSEYIREKISEYMSDRPCPTCGGKRLRPEALAVTVDGVNILQITEWPVLRSLEWATQLAGPKTSLTSRQQAISDRILKEIVSRLGFLVNVGLEYLTLHRSAGSLSGGEAQRIRLATQVGSRLVGVLYVLDEPSIGLHPRDNDRLLTTLKGLRDIGNTVLVVEHDDDTIRTADWVIDLGPGAGEHGGRIIAEGTPAQIIAHPKSLTGAYLSGRKHIPVPKKRRQGNGKILTVVGARANNLKDITVAIPLGMFVCITGVSGSGKSSLMSDVVYNALAARLNGAHTLPGEHTRIDGLEHLDKIVNIDQSPIGRTPRSNPATYTSLFEEIRRLFAELPESKVRGYKPGRFSFNVHGGRCEACQGQGELRIEMQFLPDIYVPCDVCHGTRFNRETLQVHFKGHSIADVLDMTVDQALEKFSAFPHMLNKLKLLQEVGLGYVKIGQPGNTLSGGEAQRVKLAKELSRRATGRTLYVLDEPSVGLHAADVHKLIEVLQRLVDAGNSVLIIEHNLEIIKVADWIIDLGPEGGDRGGQLVAEGTPEQLIEAPGSYTGAFLKGHLKK